MTKNTKTQLTTEGLEELKKELEYRKSVKKKELSDTLGSATAKGDLSENDEYNLALEDSLANEARISELIDLIKNAEVVKGCKSTNKICIGHKITIKNSKGKEKTLQIVGDTEANPMENKISNTSPIGKGLIGKNVGEEVKIKTPAGATKYKIVKIA